MARSREPGEPERGGRLAVVVPVRDGGADLSRCLAALGRALEGLDAEVVVVDDGSSDDSAERARMAGARVLRSGGSGLGPAEARNVGVRAVEAPVVLFVDADVVVHREAPRRLLACLLSVFESFC